MNLHKLNIRLSIYDFDLQEIKKIIDAQPSSCIKKGEIPIGGSIPSKYDIYEFKDSFFSNNKNYIDNFIFEFIERFFNYKKELSFISTKSDIELSIELIINDESDDPMPQIFFNKRIICFLKDIGAEIDIDIIR